jgi:hypothetical protein
VQFQAQVFGEPAFAHGPVVRQADGGHVGEGLREGGFPQWLRVGPEDAEHTDDLLAEAHRERRDGVMALVQGDGRDEGPTVLRLGR